MLESLITEMATISNHSTCPTENTPPEMQVLLNHQLLERIFSFLDLMTLKDVRLVSQQWGYEGGRAFRRVKIGIQTTNIEQELEDVFSFLFHHRVQHTVLLSLLPKPWYMCHPEEFTFQEYLEQKNDFQFFQVLSNSYAKAPLVRDLIVELRLEIMLRNKEDSEMFEDILKHMPKLSRLSLDLVDCEDEGFQSIPRDFIPSLRITTLGLRVDKGQREFGISWLQQSSYNYFLQLFPSLEFLDLHSWRTLFEMDEDMSKEVKCLRTICEENNANNACVKLKGLRAEYINSTKKCQALTSFPRQLQFMTLNIYQKNNETVNKVGAMLRRQSKSLKMFELIWYPDEEPELQFQKILLPKYFPELQTLKLTSYLRTPPNEIDGFNMDMVDVFCLKNLFLRNALGISMPLLTNLKIVFSSSVDNRVWEYIIPEQDDDGKPTEILQIKILTISVASADCHSPEIERYQRIFPNLTFFQHIAENGEQLHGCQHKFQGRELVEIMKSKDCTENSFECVDYDLRHMLNATENRCEGFLY